MAYLPNICIIYTLIVTAKTSSVYVFFYSPIRECASAFTDITTKNLLDHWPRKIKTTNIEESIAARGTDHLRQP